MMINIIDYSEIEVNGYNDANVKDIDEQGSVLQNADTNTFEQIDATNIKLIDDSENFIIDKKRKKKSE